MVGNNWGYYNSRDRNTAIKIFKMLIDKEISKRYNSDLSSPKGWDQFFLRENVYPLIRSNSIIQDSYLCMMYRDSIPFPTKRRGICFSAAGWRDYECFNQTSDYFICPVECRPKDHQDWNYC